MQMTEETRNSIKQLQGSCPYRIIYVMQDKDTGEQSVGAVTTMRIPNRLAREGHQVCRVEKIS